MPLLHDFESSSAQEFGLFALLAPFFRRPLLSCRRAALVKPRYHLARLMFSQAVDVLQALAFEVSSAPFFLPFEMTYVVISNSLCHVVACSQPTSACTKYSKTYFDKCMHQIFQKIISKVKFISACTKQAKNSIFSLSACTSNEIGNFSFNCMHL